MNIPDLLMYGSIFSPLIALTLIGLQWRKFSGPTFTLILTFLLASFLSDLVSWLWYELGINSLNNMPLIHLYGLVEGIILILLFQHFLKGSLKFFSSIAAVYSLAYIVDSVFLEGLFQFNAIARSAEALMIIAFILTYFYYVYESEKDIFIDSSPSFWIVVGLLIYFSGAFFSFLLSTDILTMNEERFYSSWILHNSVNILKNSFIAIGLWQMKSDIAKN
jgi:hypothetical protein